MRAVPMHLPRLRPAQARLLVRRVGQVLADSERTVELMEATELLAQAQLRALLRAGVFEDEEGRALLRDRPQLAEVDLPALRALPADSLGGAFAAFLDRHGLDPRLLQQPTPHTEDADAAYLLSRFRQSHDLWHTLLGLGTAGHEEVLVHAFTLAQTGLPGSLVIVSLGGIKHMLLERRWRTLRHGVGRAYRLGRQAAPLLSVYWEKRWEEPLAEIRRRYGIEEYSE